MASGKFHANVAKLAAHSSAIYMLLPDSIEKASFSFGMLVGILITPDLDHHKKTEEEKRFYRVDKRIGKLWFFFSQKYGRLFKHRGISHWPIVGTLTRLPFGLLFCWFWLLFLSVLKIEVDRLSALTFVFYGWAFQDLLHIITDIIYSFSKKKFKRRPKTAFKRPKRRRRKRW